MAEIEKCCGGCAHFKHECATGEGICGEKHRGAITLKIGERIYSQFEIGHGEHYTFEPELGIATSVYVDGAPYGTHSNLSGIYVGDSVNIFTTTATITAEGVDEL